MIRALLCAAALLGMSISVAQAVDLQTDKEFISGLEPVQGSWQYVSFESDIPEEYDWQNAVVTFENEKYYVTENGDLIQAGHVILNPHLLEPAIDLFITEGVGKGELRLGAYKFEYGNLIICLTQHGQHRPQNFQVKEGSGCSLMVLERVPPAEENEDSKELQ